MRRHYLAAMVAGFTGLLSGSCKTPQASASLKDAGTAGPQPLGACANVLEDVSGRSLAASDIAANGDPFAKLVIPAQGSCPTTFRAVMDRLRAVDHEGCVNVADDDQGDAFSPEPQGGQPGDSGVEVAVVSELAFFENAPVGVRPVITRQCGGRLMNDLFFSPTGFDMNAPLADAVEIIGFDGAQQLYNYYAVESGKIRFFGSSADLLKGPDTSVPFQDQPRRCANCHTSGGLVMKELTVPWANWEGGDIGLEFPGSQDVADALSTKLGLSAGASNGAIDVLPAPQLELLIEKGNARWVTTKVKLLKGRNDLQGLLRPLFCTPEINLQTSDVSDNSPTTDVDVLDDFLFNGDLVPTRPDRLLLKGAPYHAAVDQHQIMRMDTNQPLTDASGKVQHDTFVPFIYPLPADIDRRTAKELIAQNVVSADFVAAVLAADLSRPVFSTARCDLLKYAPAVDLSAVNAAQQVTDGFSAAVAADQGRSAAATDLSNNLKSTAAALAARAKQFHDTCAARADSDPQGLVSDYLKVASATRAAARELPIVEHESLMPMDDLAASADTALDPATCALKH